MNKLLQIIYSFFICTTLLAQCEEGATAGTIATPQNGMLCIVNDGSNLADLQVDTSIIDYSGTDDYAIIVTAPENENGNQLIVGVSYDGTFDFSSDEEGAPFDPGTYCFTGMGYSQGELDLITSNFVIQGFLNAGNPNCLSGGETLDALFRCVNESALGDTIDVTIAAVVELLSGELLAEILPFTPCFTIAEENYCLEVIEPGAICAATNTGIEDAIITEVAILPNPNQGEFTIQLVSSQQNEIELVIRDLAGKTIFQTTSHVSSSQLSIPVQLQGAPEGLYFYELKQGESYQTGKFQVLN
ncbi:T9SS type A sorting domain-containing protein [Chitinophagales bacterium]|nr:T9SS type A sorting domain-containing protein [Chitinophagales bacterium]